jgi:hypothetical protein
VYIYNKLSPSVHLGDASLWKNTFLNIFSWIIYLRICIFDSFYKLKYMPTTIEILDSALKEAASLGMDEFINVFTNKYLEILGGNLNAEKMGLLNGAQHSVLAYHFFREEVMEGGFVQLIQNGYGGYIFDNPFAKSMRLFGAEDFSKLIYKAKKIYDAHKEDLEKERSEDDFMAMYEQYEEFDDLEEEFLNSEEEVSSIIAEYIDEHLEEFAIIV